jgi:hypothetical protein
MISLTTSPARLSFGTPSLFPGRLVRGSFVAGRLRHVQAQPGGIQIDLVLTLLQDLSHALRVLELPQVDIGSRLLNGLTDELCGSSFTLGANDGGLLLLAGFVDDEGGPLGFLLGDLLGFYGGGEFGGEC